MFHVLKSLLVRIQCTCGIDVPDGMNSTEDSGMHMSIVLMYMYGCWNIQYYCYLAVFAECRKERPKVLLFLESTLH